MTREPADREPSFDLDLEGDPDTPWNRIALGWLSSEHQVSDADLLAVLMAEAIIAAAEAKWLGLD